MPNEYREEIRFNTYVFAKDADLILDDKME